LGVSEGILEGIERVYLLVGWFVFTVRVKLSLVIANDDEIKGGDTKKVSTV